MMDHLHSNPVVLVFLDLLRESRSSHSARQKTPGTNGEGMRLDYLEEIEGKRRRYKYRNYWFLMITLINNPKLCKYRAHQIDHEDFPGNHSRQKHTKKKIILDFIMKNKQAFENLRKSNNKSGNNHNSINSNNNDNHNNN